MLHDRLDHAKGSEKVDVEHPVPIIGRQFAERLVDGDAGIVDQVVDAAVRREHFGDHALAVGRNVDLPLMKRDGRRVFGGQFRLQGFRCILAAAESGAHPNAGFCKMPGDPGSDPARAAGDNGNFSLEHRSSAKLVQWWYNYLSYGSLFPSPRKRVPAGSCWAK